MTVLPQILTARKSLVLTTGSINLALWQHLSLRKSRDAKDGSYMAADERGVKTIRFQKLPLGLWNGKLCAGAEESQDCQVISRILTGRQ